MGQAGIGPAQMSRSPPLSVLKSIFWVSVFRSWRIFFSLCFLFDFAFEIQFKTRLKEKTKKKKSPGLDEYNAQSIVYFTKAQGSRPKARALQSIRAFCSNYLLLGSFGLAINSEISSVSNSLTSPPVAIKINFN